MANVDVRAEDLLPVRSRVSWGAIFAGAAVALALYFLLSLLGAAVGLSVSDSIRSENLGTGAAIWAVVSMLISLFLGGVVTSQCTAGENQLEAFLYGVILWGVMFASLVWLMATGVRMGFNAMLGAANVAALSRTDLSTDELERRATRAGLTPEQVARLKAATPAPEDVRALASDPQTQAVATRAAWWAFGGTLLSMLAAIGGSLAGSGPSPILRRFVTVSSSRTTLTAPPASRV